MGFKAFRGGLPFFGARPVAATDVLSATKYASPTGTGNGSIDNPYDLQTAFNGLVEGDVLFLRGGNYDIPTIGLRINSKAGTAQHPIIIESYPGEVAILDGKNRVPQDIIDGTYPTSFSGGLQLNAYTSYIYFRKLKITGMSYIALHFGGNNCKLQGCEVYNNFGAGVHLSDDVKGYTVPYVGGWHSIEDNLIHDNSDAGIEFGSYNDGDNADGISISSGQSNYVGHNTVYHNSDDAMDSWKSNDALFEYNVAHSNGLGGRGNGNGIKMGGDAAPADGNGLRCVSQKNIVYGNRANAFDSSGGIDNQVLYNTSWGNQWFKANFNSDRGSIVSYNISYEDGGIDPYGSPSVGWVYNSWQIGGTVTVASEDPESPDFLRPTSAEHLAIGAYAGL